MNLSFIKNIDFKNSDTLLFFCIVLFLAVILIVVILFVLIEIGKFLKNLFYRNSHINFEEELDDKHSKQQPAFRQNPAKIKRGWFAVNFGVPKQSVKQNEAAVGRQKNGEELERLKAGASTASSDGQNANENGRVAMPGPKAGQEGGESSTGAKIDASNNNYSPNIAGIGIDKNAAAPSAIQNRYGPQKEAEKSIQPERPVLERPEILKNLDSAKSSMAQSGSGGGGGGGSILFGNKKTEVTRRELRYRLRKDPKIYKAAKESLLYLTPAQRVQMEKDLFPTTYGLNISKSDIKTRMRKLSQKMLSEKNPQAKALLRKEIKFVKKIGGF